MDFGHPASSAVTGSCCLLFLIWSAIDLTPSLYNLCILTWYSCLFCKIYSYNLILFYHSSIIGSSSLCQLTVCYFHTTHLSIQSYDGLLKYCLILFFSLANCYIQLCILTETDFTRMSVLLILQRKCMLATLRAAPWWVMLIMRRVPY